MRMKRGRLLGGGPGSKVFTRRLHTRPKVQPCPYVAGLDANYLFVIAHSGRLKKKKKLQQHVQHMMCEAAHLMKIIGEVWEMVSDDYFLSVLHKANMTGFI